MSPNIARERPLQAWEIAELPLADLLRGAQPLTREGCRDSIRVAVLGDGATQYYVGALAAALKCRGFWPEMYEAEFDVIRQEVLDPASGLHRHAPQVVVLFNCVQALERSFAADGDPPTFGRRTAADLAALWDHLRRTSGAAILQHNLCLPFERPFGNFSLASGVAFAAQVQALNAALAEEARLRAGIQIVDTESQAAYFGRRQWLDDRLWCQARQALAPRFLPPLVKSVSDAILLGRGVGVKCLAFDLDDTIWGGTLGEVGLEGLELGESGVGLAYRRVQEAIHGLARRGVLLAVCSKNDEALVRRVFREHPDMALREPDIAAFEVHFEPKVDSLRRIAARLNIGLDAFVFLDDSAFERDFVRTALPEVQVPAPPEDPAELPAALARWNLFEAGPPTAEDVQRRALYRTDTARAELRAGFTDVDSYLRDLEMEAEIQSFDAFSLPRVAQLLQRTNQFNLTTRRHGEAALQAFQDDPRAACFSVRLLDRLGDNGIVAAVIGVTSGSDLVIDTWVMSCRVFGRCLEAVTLAAIVERARGRGCRRVIGHYAATTKNAIVADLYPRLGFAAGEAGGAVSVFALEVASFAPAAVPIGVRRPVHEE